MLRRGFAVVVAAAVSGCVGGPGRRSVIGPSTTLAVPVAATAATTTTASTTSATDPGTLAQTKDRPSGDDPAFQARMKLLWEAIVADHVGIALPAFFPLAAYRKVKAVRDPAGDWQHRLLAEFDGDITSLHASLGASPAAATLTAVVVPDARAMWVPPGAELNRIGYWRVYDTTVTFTDDGAARSFVVISLISWRGQWYVVHLRTPPR